MGMVHDVDSLLWEYMELRVHYGAEEPVLYPSTVMMQRRAAMMTPWSRCEARP